MTDTPYLADGHRAFARTVEEFVTREVAPRADARTDDDARALLGLISGAGFTRYCVPVVHGGLAVETRAALDTRALAVLRESLAGACGVADLVLVMQALGSLPISLAGTPEQCARWLPGVAAGRTITAFALTEPEAGSDVAALATRATRTGDAYVLHGHKRFISQATVADLLVVFARTGGDGARGISAFAVERSAPGLSVVPQAPMAPHPLGEVHLDGVRVPAAHRLGEEGTGMRTALRALDVCRPSVAAAACGMARRALAESITRARTRKQFGKPLWEHQLIGQKLARMATDLAAAQLLAARACAEVDAGGDATGAVSQAKLFATEAAGRIVDDAVQIHGGEGVMAGSVVERLYREVRALRIYEGTSEVQHLVIARALCRD
ncbi:MAG: acyl-CoA dehydrogenase family protein [Deltaproteobacteria bacterium]|nr:acyl-CoA dehydrogenase family protein [Deltaproteobacteria bacterium]